MKIPYAWIKERLSEPSTYRGITWILTSLGVTVSPAVAVVIFSIGSALAGIIDIVKKDEKNR